MDWDQKVTRLCRIVVPPHLNLLKLAGQALCLPQNLWKQCTVIVLGSMVTHTMMAWAYYCVLTRRSMK